MDALEWDDDEIVTRARRWRASPGRPRVRIFGMHATLRPGSERKKPRLALSLPRTGMVRAQYVYGDESVDEAAETNVIERISPAVAEAVLAAKRRATEYQLNEGESVEIDLADLFDDDPIELRTDEIEELPEAGQEVPQQRLTDADQRRSYQDMLPPSWTDPIAASIADAPTYSGFNAELTSDTTSDGEQGTSFSPAARLEQASLLKPRRRSRNLGRLAAAALMVVAGGLLAYELVPRHGLLWAELDGGEQTPLTEVMSVPAPAPIMTKQGVALASPQHAVEVFVDGQPRGLLPLRLDDLEPGDHQLRFETARHHTLERTVTVVAGQVKMIDDLRLELARGLITIEVDTVGAHVVLGRRGTRRGRKTLYGPWPKDIELDPAVDWEILAARPGFVAKAFPVSLDERGEQRIVVKLPYDPWFHGAPEDIYED